MGFNVTKSVCRRKGGHIHNNVCSKSIAPTFVLFYINHKHTKHVFVVINKNKKQKNPIQNMAAKIPMTFMRTAEAFEMIARSKGCPGSSSGSEYDVVDDDDKLFDHVNAFIEREDGDDFLEEKGCGNVCEGKREGGDNEFVQYERALLSIDNDDFVKRNLRNEVEKSYGFSGGGGGGEFKRRMMAKLREKGFDAGESLIAFNFLCFDFIFH